MPTAYLKTESVGSDTHRQNARKYRPRTKLIGPWLYLCHCGSQIYCSGTITDLSRRGRQLPLLAGSSQGGVQVGRRKPVTQGDPAREILAGSPTAGDGRVREVTNGSFGAAKLAGDPSG